MNKDRDAQEGDTSGDGATALEFKMEEFKALRSEISALMLENQTIERYAGAAVAAVVTWLLTTNGIAPLAKAAAWTIPLLISMLAALRAKGIQTRLTQIGCYIRIIERKNFKTIGWEVFLWKRSLRREKRKLLNKNKNRFMKIADQIRAAPFVWTARAYWGTLICTTAIFFVAGSITSLISASSVDANAEIRLEQSSGDGGQPIVITAPGYRLQLARPPATQ